MQIDNMDRQLLALLGENARMPISELARRLGLARTTVQARMERLERSGAIVGYTIRRGAALQPPLRATVLIAVEPRAGPAVVDRLRVLSGVEKVYTTSGRFDLLAQVVAGSTAELDATLDRIAEVPGLRSSESLIHLATKIDRG